MKKITLSVSLFVAFAATVLYSCKKDKTIDTVNSGKEMVLDLPETPYTYYQKMRISTLNADQKATLGRVLFYDKQLSLNNSVSCASCHKQAFAFADDVAFSKGFENMLTHRNSMPIQNLFSRHMVSSDPVTAGSQFGLFWDSRELSLMSMVLKPVANHVEMGIDNIDMLPAKLSALPYYKKLFNDAFGTEEITVDRIRQGITMFVSSIVTDNSRFDQNLALDSMGFSRTLSGKGMSALEMVGYNLFIGKYNCASCHNVLPGGYTGTLFMDIGLDESYTDLGIGTISRNPNQNGTFRIPNLRNVALTAPYMHDGRFKTLEEVIDHYSKGIKNSPNLDDRLRDDKKKPMKMNITNDDKRAIIAFLNTLTDYEMITDPKFSDPFKIR